MTRKDRADQIQKLTEALNICRAELKRAQESGIAEDLKKAKQRYYKNLEALDKAQPKRKN
jgi:hypothetical protein